MKEVCRDLETKRRTTSSDLVANRFPNYLPSEIRSLLKNPTFILTHRGWRLPMIGRILVFMKSTTGYIVITDDYLHKPVPSCERRGDYAAKEYSITQRKAIGKTFYIWHREIRNDVDV